jgi:ferric-dicitrate binding protein FerR (iron transport regulator)
MPLLSGDRLRTTDGRVEVRFADGGRLHLDARTSLDVQSDELVRLGDGRLRLTVQRAYQVNYRVDSPAGTVHIMQPGEYRVSIIHGDRETQLELAVIRGAGEIFTDQGTTLVRSGERANSSAGLIPSYAYSYNSANMDDFDRWSEMQRGTV